MPRPLPQLGTPISLNAQVTIGQDAIASIVWTPEENLSCTDCLNPIATPTTNSTYQIEVTDTNGCFAIAQIDLFITDPSIDVFVPNIFSPNGDGINDELTVFANTLLVKNVKQFLLFDRWGESVFENSDFPPNVFGNGWDGIFKGEIMNPGVFVWLVEVELVNGERRLLEGEVVLMR